MISIALQEKLAQALRLKILPGRVSLVPGGCINECYRVESDSGSLFVKIADASRLAMFQAEAEGLQELARAAAVRVPKVIATGSADDSAYLVLEWIDLRPTKSSTEAEFCEQLAQLHRFTAKDFGWHRDNTIGLTPQINARTSNWVEFFREHRLRYQLDLARRNGYGGRLQECGSELLSRMDVFFDGYHPVPSLLHGDLWSGNWSATSNDEPVIFDPAPYYGDREADIAMTRLFGGFGAKFYSAYQAAWPLDAGAQARVALYNLYHVLNHLNLFGGGYLRQAEAMLDELLGLT